MAEDDGFLSRWSRRKAQVRSGAVAPATPVPLPEPAAPVVPEAAAAAPEQPAAPPSPTMAEVDALTIDADFSRFVAPTVDGDVKNAALKKLFTDPHFNVMDGLDTYIDDYGKPDPLPAGMLRQMVQSQLLGLFSDEDDKDMLAAAADLPPEPPATAAAATDALPDPLPDPLPERLPETLPDENSDLRLQPDDDAGRAGVAAGAGEDAGRQH